MNLSALGVDLYQLTSYLALRNLLPAEPLWMSFFFRRLPRHRRFVVACGYGEIVEHAKTLSFGREEVGFLRQVIPNEQLAIDLLRVTRFEGDIDALPEGTIAHAGPARRRDGSVAYLNGVPLCAATPLLQVRTSLLQAKLVETPWLSRLNHMSMVASKAVRVAMAARADGVERPVFEFGQRRTDPDAAVRAAYAACVAGCTGTSNVAAAARYGIPVVGTMDHFAVMACEDDGSRDFSEETIFRRMLEENGDATLLVDTYDTDEGIRRAVRAARSAGRPLKGIRIDSNVTPQVVRGARDLLAALGSPQTKITVSDGLDEYRVVELAAAGADAFGVGENITCSPDAATGIGAVGKLVQNSYGTPVAKTSKGSGKATLPGPLQCYRGDGHDLLQLADEPAPAGYAPLLQPLWRGCKPVAPPPPLREVRDYVRRQVDALPAPLRSTGAPDGTEWPVVLSDALYDLTCQLAAR